MAFLSTEQEIKDLYEHSSTESRIWREDYHEFERLADNGILDTIDPNLPKVNDGTLAASLFKLPKRVVPATLTGRFTSDRDEAWVAELANIVWEEQIVPNANSQANFIEKWKTAVRKAAIYGSVPIIDMFVNRGNYTGSDFIIAQPQDVKLEPGKVSDNDSDVIFWDVYFTKLQVKGMIERAEKEKKDGDTYNKWNIPALKKILEEGNDKEERPSDEDNYKSNDEGVKRQGIKFCIVYQRGVEAPFYMYHKDSNQTVREWANPDPTGDMPVHFLYCYQDFINPYGIGVVKLGGGTQNILDMTRQVDVLATLLGIRPPLKITGNEDDVDIDSLVYQPDALWFIGNGAQVERQELSSQVYQQLPTRQGMYKTSLNQIIPTGDTSISAESGDPNYSKTPAGVKFQQASLSVDDQDFKDKLYITYQAVAKSMVNNQFANMQGSDILKLKDDQRDRLTKAGLEFPIDEEGNPTNELEIIWDEARASFDFEMDVEQDKAKDEEKRLEGLLKAYEITQGVDPNILQQKLLQSGKQLNEGELLSEIISLSSDNDKIIEDIDPEELEGMQAEQQMQEQMMAEQQMAGEQAQGQPEQPPQEGDESLNIQAIMEEYQVPENVAMAMREAEMQGEDPEDIMLLKDALMTEVANV